MGNAEKTYGADKVGVLAAPRMTLEEAVLTNHLAIALNTQEAGSFGRSQRGGPRHDLDEILGNTLSTCKMEDIGHADLILLAGADPSATHPVLGMAIRRALKHGAKLIVNDDVVLAVSCGADGVHLGSTDGSIRDARRLLPPDTIIGASCYNDLALVQQAIKDGASYVAFGACFDSPTKPAARRVSAKELAAFRTVLGPSVPICGIGGITLDNVDTLAGNVDAVALISELFGTPDTPATPERVGNRVRQFMAQPLAA